MASVAWQEWSEFGKQELSVTSANPTDIEKDLQFDDTWHFALGAQYQINPELRWSFGISHDTSPIDKAENRSPDVPFDRVWRFATGFNYQVKENMSFGLAYEYMDLGPAEIDITGNPVRGDLKGEYDTNAHFSRPTLTGPFKPPKPPSTSRNARLTASPSSSCTQ